MKKLTDSQDYADIDNDLLNIIQINNTDSDAAEDDQDHDLDYDPNEMYFALLQE